MVLKNENKEEVLMKKEINFLTYYIIYEDCLTVKMKVLFPLKRLQVFTSH
jgi:hypothetical protein